MALTTIYIGRHVTTPESATGNIGSDAARAFVADPPSVNAWIVGGGFVGGKAGSGTAAVRMAVYDVDGSLTPRTRLGYMAPVNVTTQMLGGGDGTNYTAAVSGSDNGPTNAAILAFAGRHIAIDLLSANNAMRHSMVAAADVAADSEQFFDRTSPSNPQPSAFGSGYVASTQGQITAYLTCYENTAPIAPNNRTPSGTVNDTAPLFECDFRDLCGAYGASSGDGLDLGDRPNQIQIQLRAVGTTALLWNTTLAATGTEKSTDHISRAYGGSALTRGTAYEWRVRTSDEFGAWGDWSTWLQFTPANLGFVTLNSNPTGKIESNQPAFEGRWTHQAATSMKRVQVRVLAADGATVLQTGADYDIADVASSASPGTLFTVPWANAGFATLAWGTAYTYQVRGYDGTQWSDWSAARSFSTNAAPTVPGGLSPSGGAVFTSLPKLTATFSDADDTTATGLTGVFRITRPDTSTVDVAPTFNTTTGKWEYQTTAAELSAFGAYSWKAIGYDGTLYSGESTTLAGGTFSSGATFTYASGPVVAVSSPADGATVTGAELDVAWSVTSGGPQVKYQVLLYPDGGSTPVYDSGLLTGTATSHRVPSGHYRNGDALDLVVRVQNGTPLDGYSNLVNLLVAFAPPAAPSNFQANPVRIGSDAFATANRLTWDQTAYAAPDFDHTTIYRSADGGPDAAEIILARIASPAVTQFVDYTPASGYVYAYSATVSTVVGADMVESDRATATASVALEGTVLTLMGNGGTYRACLLNVTERDGDRTIQESVYQSPASTRPVTVRAATRYWVSSFAGVIVGDAIATAAQRADELDALDATNGTVCVRDGRGRKRFCKIGGFKLTDQKPDHYAFSFTAREELAAEGVS